MKILFCANIYEGGFVGPARLAEGLLKINELYRGRHELRILTADVKVEQLPVYKMTVRYPRLLRFFDFWFRGWAFYKGILRVKKEFDIDVVLFGNATYGLVAKVFYSQLLTGGFINDYNVVSVKWSNFFKHDGGKSLLLLSYVERFAARRLDFIFVCSDYLRRAIIDRYGTPEKNLYLLYQGIDLENIPYRSRQIEVFETIKILFVKYRFKLGGLQDLAVALSLLPEYSFLVTVMGPPQEHFEETKIWFDSISHVKLVLKGSSPQADVHAAMQDHDILCIPSHLEAQGLANVEGLAHGISVVSSRAGGIPEVLDKGNNGWLCEPGNPASLAIALRESIITSRDTRLQILMRGRRFAEQHFDYTVMLEKLLDILAEQIQKRKSES